MGHASELLHLKDVLAYSCCHSILIAATALAFQLSPISSKPASSYRIKTSHFYGY
jgi:hypothetical protein